MSKYILVYSWVSRFPKYTPNFDWTIGLIRRSIKLYNLEMVFSFYIFLHIFYNSFFNKLLVAVFSFVSIIYHSILRIQIQIKLKPNFKIKLPCIFKLSLNIILI